MSKLQVDSVDEVTSANGVTIDGLNIKDSKLTTANSVVTTNITDANVTTAKITDANVTTAKIADANVTTAKIADANVTTAKIADANITVAKMAANSVDSNQYVDGSIDTAHIANDQITNALMADNAIDTAQIAASAVETAKINDDAVTLGKMAPGTDGNIISYDASGNPVAVATGNSGQVLTSAGAGAPPTFATIAGGLTEVDLLRKSANQAISASTASVVSANWERDDTLSEKIGNGMSESSGVFTFPSSGIYLIQSQMYLYGFGASGAESAQYVQLLIQGTADNSNFVTLVDSSIPATANTGVRYVTNRAHTIFDCTNTSTHKVKFQVWIQGLQGTLYGSSSVNASFASFIKLGDT